MRNIPRSYRYVAGIAGLLLFIVVLGFLYTEFGPFISLDQDDLESTPAPVAAATAVDPQEADEPEEGGAEEVVEREQGETGDESGVSDGSVAPGGSGAVVKIEKGQRIHIVLPGEILPGIAEQYGLEWTMLADLNGIDNADELTAGDMLILPPVSELESDAAGEEGDSDTVDDSGVGAEEGVEAGSEEVEQSAGGDEEPTGNLRESSDGR